MAKAICKLEIDTSEAMEKINKLKTQAENLKDILKQVKTLSQEMEGSMVKFNASCENLSFDIS
jgi:NTP pyrophosphatase (non-canonical NTP hydrolase)